MDATETERIVEEVARIAHEVNRGYCESLGDTSQPSWADAPDWQRDSLIAGVRAHLSNPDMTPEDSHRLWWERKNNDGWVFGEEKDPEKKTHPCMILPYEALSQEHRAKDFIFKAVVGALNVDRDEGTEPADEPVPVPVDDAAETPVKNVDENTQL